MKHLLTVLSFFVLGLSVLGQQANTDSLRRVWNDVSKPDSIRLIAINDLAWSFVFNKPDSTLKLSQVALDLAEQRGYKSIKAKALKQMGVAYLVQNENETSLNYFDKSFTLYQGLEDDKNTALLLNNMGVVYNGMGEFDKALDYFKESLEIREGLNDWNGIAASLHTIGDVYRVKGDFASATNYFFKSLEIRETQAKNAENLYEWKRGMANTLNNIGLIYNEQQEKKLALDYYMKSLAIREELKEQYGQAVSLSNIGRYYLETKQYEKALKALDKSLAIQKELEDKQGMAINLGHKGSIFKKQEKYTVARENFEKSLELGVEINDVIVIATAYKNLGDNYLEQGNISKAIEYAQKGLEYAQEVGATKETKEAAEILFKAYKMIGNTKKALEMHELFIQFKDSVQGAENAKRLLSLEYEKKAFADSLEFAKQKEISDLEYELQLDRARLRQYALWSGIALLLALGVTAFNAYRNKRIDNQIIRAQKQKVEEQKQLVEEKNQKIWDSITYAQRIQNAIQPPPRLFKQALPDSYIIYLPKDLVAGDFFWLEEVGDTILYAVADCTGHGVPGAIVSVVCNNALNRSVREFGLREPAKILDKTRELVIETFEKSEEEVKDGMDIALCALNKKTRQLQYAGAHNSLYLITNNAANAGERALTAGYFYLTEVKADRQPIGKYEKSTPFTNHQLQLQENDVIVLFSDGFADQFGGPDGKKFKYKPFKELLLSIHEKSMENQKTFVLRTFENWKGKEEQIDDVCVIGVRV